MEKRRIRRGVQCVLACLGIVVTVTSAACMPSPKAPHQTVEYYRTHPAERTAMLDVCANDPGALAETPDCVNARVAARRVGIGSLRELPPIGLSSSSTDAGAQVPPQGTADSERSQ
jgi:hypothetical protein